MGGLRERRFRPSYSNIESRKRIPAVQSIVCNNADRRSHLAQGEESFLDLGLWHLRLDMPGLYSWDSLRWFVFRGPAVCSR